MKNKLINLKLIFQIVMLLVVILTALKSCAKAYTFDDFVYFIQTNQEKLNQIGGTWKSAANFYASGTGYTKAKAYFGDEEFQGFGIGNSTSYYLSALNNVTSLTKSGNFVSCNGSKKYIDTYSYNPSSPSYGTSTGGLGSIRVLLLSGFPNFEYPSGVLSVNEYTPQNPFYFGHMFSQNYNYNNEVIQACELNYNYRIQFIENVITESYEVTNITATLDDITLESTDLGSYWTLKCTNSTLLKYDKIYTLNVEITTTSNTYELSEEILFVPPGTLIESGVIVNYPSGDYSFNTENATNQIIENQDNSTEKQTQEIIDSLTNSNEVENIMDETLSGDIETISGQLGFSPLENPFTSFLFFVVDGVYDVLTERENITLTAPYKSVNFTIKSQDFITPNSELKTFIRNMLICVYIYGNYKYFHYMITLLETARINKFMAEIGTDEFYDTDIM